MSLDFTPRIRRVIAIGLLLLALLVTTAFVLVPLYQHALASVEQLKDTEFERQRLRALATAPAGDLTLLRQRRQRLADAVLVAPDPSQAITQLQAQLTSLFDGNGLTVSATRAAPQTSVEALSLVALSLDVMGSERAWLDTLEALEKARPYLLVRRLDITAPQTEAPDRQLRGQMIIASVWIPPQEAE